MIPAGSDRRHGAVTASQVDFSTSPILNQYHAETPLMGTNTIYASQVRVGTSYAVVQPPAGG